MEDKLGEKRCAKPIFEKTVTFSQIFQITYACRSPSVAYLELIGSTVMQVNSVALQIKIVQSVMSLIDLHKLTLNAEAYSVLRDSVHDVSAIGICRSLRLYAHSAPACEDDPHGDILARIARPPLNIDTHLAVIRERATANSERLSLTGDGFRDDDVAAINKRCAADWRLAISCCIEYCRAAEGQNELERAADVAGGYM